MPDYDAGFKIVARESGRELAELGDVASDAWEPIAGEVHAAERLADRAFRARLGTKEFVVYMEAYTRWEAKAPWSVLAIRPTSKRSLRRRSLQRKRISSQWPG